MNFWLDYINVKIPIIRLGHNQRYQVADRFAVGDVVMTRNLLDIGLVAEVDGGRPAKILARDSGCLPGDVPPQYGGINNITWYHTGVRMSPEDWKNLSRNTDAAGFYRYWHTKLHIKD